MGDRGLPLKLEHPVTPGEIREARARHSGVPHRVHVTVTERFWSRGQPRTAVRYPLCPTGITAPAGISLPREVPPQTRGREVCLVRQCQDTWHFRGWRSQLSTQAWDSLLHRLPHWAGTVWPGDKPCSVFGREAEGSWAF